MKLLFVCFLVVSCLVTMAQQQQNQTQYPTEIYLGQSSPSHRGLTVNDVIQMSQAGVSEDVILKQIQKKGQRLDLGTNDILKLKNAGVSSRVISAMLDPNGPIPSSAPVGQGTADRSGPSGGEPHSTTVSTAPQTSVPQNGVTTAPPPTMPAVPVPLPSSSLSPASPPVQAGIAGPPNDGKIRVYVTDRPITEVVSMIQGGSYGSAHASGYASGGQASYSGSAYQASHVGGITNDQRGGADPRTLEVSGDLAAECHASNLVVTSNPDAAEYILDFRRRGGTRSTWFVFGGLSGLAISAAVKVDHAGLYKPDGDLIVAAKARTVGGAVKEICPYLATTVYPRGNH